uniref:EGF-like domain-containing protein n=1 Tax=Strongyloides stercoralis TaxID=6248 RepID=A0A0K0ELF6_STRER
MSSLHARSSISGTNSNMYSRPRSRSRQPIYTSDKRAKFAQRENKKYIRFVTVIAYIICVSLPAICLSIYYINFWDPRYIDKFTKIENPLINNSDGVIGIADDKTIASSRIKLLKKEISRKPRDYSLEYSNTIFEITNNTSNNKDFNKIIDNAQILPTDSYEKNKDNYKEKIGEIIEKSECKCTCPNDNMKEVKKPTILKRILSGKNK